MHFTARYKVHIGALLAFTAITFFYFPKLFTGFSTLVETNDGRLVAWILSWDIHKLFTDPVHIFQSNTFYPNPNTLTYSEHFIGTSILGIPAWLFSGGNPAVTFNFVMIFGYVSNAFCTFLLLRKLVRNDMVAFLGAFINGFCSYRLWNIAHLQDIIVFYIPLCLLFFYSYLDTRKAKYFIGIGFCLLLQSLSSWYHMIFILLLFFIVVLYYYFIEKQLTIRDLQKLAVTLIAVFIIIIPFAIPYLKQNKENQTAYVLADIMSSDFGGYFLAPPYTFFSSINFNYFGISKTRWLENFNYIGYVAVFLTVFCLYKVWNRNKSQFSPRREVILFLVIAVIFFILSFGPFLIINDKATSVKLPYYFIFKLLSPLRFLRVVARYATVVYLMTTILASYGLIIALKNIEKRSYRLLICTLLFLLAFIEYTPLERFDRFSDMSHVPLIYQQVKRDPDVKALIELPINVDPFTTTRYVYYAGIHFKPIVNGYSGYEPPSYSLYKNLFDAPVSAFTTSLLTSLGVTHILCNPEYNKPVDATVATLIKEDSGYRLYKIKPVSRSGYYMEPISSWQRKFSTNDSLLHINKVLDGVNYNAANQYTDVSNISPKAVNQPATLLYTSSKPLDALYIKFRTYAPTDTLRIECFKQKPGVKDSLSQTYVYTNTSAFLNDFAVLNLQKADKVKFTLYASAFPDRTFIRDLIFVDHK